MSLRIKNVSVFVVAGIVYLIGQYFRGVWFLGSTIPNVCGHATDGAGTFCNSPYIEILGWPLIIVGEILTIVGMIMLFANARSWKTWIHFSYWFVPLAALIAIFVFPIPMPLGLELSRVGAIRILGTLYAILSAGIVIVSYLGAWMRKEKGTPNKA